MSETIGVIEKSLSGFYYVRLYENEKMVACRARGRFRHDGNFPLVGDRVSITQIDEETGRVDSILERKNFFLRPAVANLDLLIFVASGAIPVTDPYLIDRMAAIAEYKGIEVAIVINKNDLDPAETLKEIYTSVGYPVISCSAETGAGIEEIRQLINGKLCAFSGNSGVGKSSILNRLSPSLHIQVGEISPKLGRGRHTTRHVELFHLGNGTLLADTPGFAAFDVDQMELCTSDALQNTFPEFRPYLSSCRFRGCLHGKDKGCAVRKAVQDGFIHESRYQSYLRLLSAAKEQENVRKP